MLSLCRALLFGAVVVLAWPTAAGASPRGDVADAYTTAADEISSVARGQDLPAALAKVDEGIAAALSAGLEGDPALAKMYAMQAGLVFVLYEDRARATASCREAVKLDYNVKLPIELASEDLTEICNEARAQVPRPTEAVVHTTPVGTPDAAVEFVAIANTAMPIGSTLVLYWRTAGSDAEFAPVEMVGDGDGNWGVAKISVSKHHGRDIEYFFRAFDPSERPVASRGDRDNPLRVTMNVPAATTATRPPPARRERPRRTFALPRFFVNLGVGTGLGFARGRAEQTYEQYHPATPGSVYGLREQACALERWYAGEGDLAPDAFTFQQHLIEVESFGAVPYAAGDEAARTSFATAYDPGHCVQRQPVSAGWMSAPLHIAPEVGLRVGRALVVSVYGRFQVVTGSRVVTEDRSLDRVTSFSADVRGAAPAGVRQRPPFTWAVGAKVKYFFGRDDRRLRLFAGGFAGYGQARLRAPLNLSNDRNGNSVPDLEEVGLSGPLNAEGVVDPSTCTAVWPYVSGCSVGAQGDTDRMLALSVRGSTALDDARVDTVVIGPAMLGALFGIHYQVHPNVALFAELNAGAWLPSTTSALFDLNLGPAITF